MRRRVNLVRHRLQAAIVAVASLTLVATQAQAQNGDVIAKWTFEANPPTTAGPYSADEGAGSALGFHSNAAAVYSNPVGNGSLESFSSNNWLAGDYYQFQASTTGMDEIGLIFDQTRSSTGPNSFQLQYSTNGTSFTNFGDPYSFTGTSWSSGGAALDTTYSFDLRSVAALENKSNVYFRLTNLADASAATGTNRVDNFSIYSNFIPPIEPPPEADPRLPMAGDLVMGVNSANAAKTIKLASGAPVTDGGTGGPGPWSTTPSIQSVEFDNFGGTRHNANGNLLGVRFSTGGTGQIYSFGTNTSIPAPDGQLIGNTGATDPVGQSGGLTAVSLAGLSVAPGNGKISVFGSRAANASATPPVEAYSSVIVYNYTPGNATGSDAALANGREISLDLSGEAQPGQTQATAWLSDTKLVTFSPAGTVTEITDNGTTLSKQVIVDYETPGIGSDYASIAYNPDVSPYVFAMYSGFDGSDSSAYLYVMDPANNYNLVKLSDQSTSIGSATAREIALDADGNLFIGGFGSVVNVLPNAANVAGIADNSTVKWWTSQTFSSFNGLDIGFQGEGQLGDYNGDGKVDAADYTVWRDHLGGDSSVLHGNGSGAATVVPADYALWKTHFGQHNPGAGGLAGGAVPEPTSALLTFVAVVGLAASRRSVR
jgi:hypothetical protein